MSSVVMRGDEVTPRPDISRVLVVTAHPDDVDFGAAGTVATYTKAGIEVAYCVCTSGDAGGFDDTPRDQMPALREREQRAAAAELGVEDVTFLGYPDGRLTASIELRRDLVPADPPVPSGTGDHPVARVLLGEGRRVTPGP